LRNPQKKKIHRFRKAISRFSVLKTRKVTKRVKGLFALKAKQVGKKMAVVRFPTLKTRNISKKAVGSFVFKATKVNKKGVGTFNVKSFKKPNKPQFNKRYKRGSRNFAPRTQVSYKRPQHSVIMCNQFFTYFFLHFFKMQAVVLAKSLYKAVTANALFKHEHKVLLYRNRFLK